ncbi:eCIS core domain-containing protein [Bradyrhizobium lablabi]|uniref:eCIS core domain-containing protein n=1 Tax=Bradyrhizobium lablabi TaxID=722472 RepID=UPI001560A0F4|nr:DUF4157 domain-containing protein [Bradyrhizobium lablabi]
MRSTLSAGFSLPAQRRQTSSEIASLEVEADAVADRLSMPANRLGSVQPAFGQSGAPAVPNVVKAALLENAQPLDASTRSFFQPRFGYDFSRVRLHSGEAAAESARLLDARAYTVGEHVVLGSPLDTPGAFSSRRLLAHELAHVVQQGGGMPLPGRAPHGPSQIAVPAHVARQSLAPGGSTASSARDDFLRAVDRGDAVGIESALARLTEQERGAISANPQALATLDRKLPAVTRLLVRMKLQFGQDLPADVRALVSAAEDGDADRVVTVLRANVRLRDPKDVPGLRAMLLSVFATDARKQAAVANAYVLTKDEMLAYARQSPHLVEQEAQAKRTLMSAQGRDLNLVADTNPGQTQTNSPSGTIIVSAPGGREDFALKYSHELSNLRRDLLTRDAQGRGGSPKPDQYRSGDAYADAILQWEAESVVDRAIVGAELGSHEGWISDLGRDFKAGKISKADMLKRVVAALGQFTSVGEDNRQRPARQNYKLQWERWAALAQPRH